MASTFASIPVRRLFCGLLLLTGIILTSCGSANIKNTPIPPLQNAVTVDPPAGSLLLAANTYAADALSAMLLPRMGSGSGLLVTTMVNMDNFDSSSSLGRMSMQQISSRMSQHGYKVLEARLGSKMRMDVRDGEFMLTRDAMELLAQDYPAHAVLVGVYSQSRNQVFLSVRMVRLSDSAVIAAYEYYLPKDADIQALLRDSEGKASGGVWERYALRPKAFP